MERITPKYIYEFQCMLERTDAITNEVLQPITYVLTYQHYATSAISRVIFFFSGRVSVHSPRYITYSVSSEGSL